MSDANVSESITICPLDELEPDSARRFDIDGHRLAVVRLGDEVHIIGDKCSHADFSLAEGELDTSEKTLECWKHGSAFSLETGEPTCFPAVKGVPVYDVVIEGGIVKATVNTNVQASVQTPASIPVQVVTSVQSDASTDDTAPGDKQ